MKVNSELFDIVEDLTAGGLLVEAAGILGMSFSSIKLAEMILNNKKDDREELNNAIKVLVDKNLLLLKEDIYYVNSDYVQTDDF